MYMITNKTAANAHSVLLAKRLGIPICKPDSVLPDNIGINWGNSTILFPGKLINKPEAVKLCVNKIQTLSRFYTAGIPTVKWSTKMTEALSWGTTVYCRTIITGSKGKGVVVVPAGQELPKAPLYTEAFPTEYEFRAHVAFGKVIDFIQKKRMGKEKLAALGLEKPDMLIRSNKRGWVFARKDLALTEYHSALQNIAIEAVKSLGLDFGAVDMLVNSDPMNIAVCEVNSAPGLCSTTLTAYTKAFQEAI